MEWTNESTIEFLRLYEKEDAIWNPKSEAHKNRNLVADAWARIQESFSLQCTVPELKKKKESLMATFRPLLSKVKASMKTGSSPDDIYKPNWFAFETMAKFLMGVFLPRSTISTQGLEEDVAGDQERSMNIEENIDVTLINTDDNYSTPGNVKGNGKKRKHIEVIESRMEDAYKMMKTVYDNPKKDVCGIYGELIGEKLRQFDECTRDWLMHEIDGLILRTKFQNQLPPSSASSQHLQPDYHVGNFQGHVSTPSYSTYNSYPVVVPSTSSYHSQTPNDMN